MDWSKSKSIFIVVFLILDVFLFSLYLNRHTEAQRMGSTLLAERTIEARLKDDNITYSTLPTNIKTAPYISGKVKNFEKEDIDIPNAQTKIIENQTKLLVTLDKPVDINVKEPDSFDNFLKSNVLEGASYTLWEVDDENKKATFFQTVNSSVIYHNKNGLLTIYWNDEQEVIKYEQTLLEDITAYEKQQTLSMPLRAIQTLYNKGLLLPNSTVLEVDLGYSTLLPSTQVFVPTWEVRVETEDGDEEVYFVNAVQGGVIDLKLNVSRVEDAVDEAITDDNGNGDGDGVDIEKELNESKE